MRRYSDSERSSALTRRDSASSRRGETRSLISSVHFSDIVVPQKNAGTGSDARPASKPRMVTGEGGRRDDVAAMSGGLLFGSALGGHLRYLIGAQRWDCVAPLIDGLHGNAKDAGKVGDVPEEVDGFTRFHSSPIKPYFIQVVQYVFKLRL